MFRKQPLNAEGLRLAVTCVVALVLHMALGLGLSLHERCLYECVHAPDALISQCAKPQSLSLCCPILPSKLLNRT